MSVIVGYLGTDTATQGFIRYFNCSTAAELPTTGYSLANGDLGYAQDTDSIYAWDGAAWDQFVPLSATGVAGQVAYFTGINSLGGDAGLTYDATANKVSITDSSAAVTPLLELFQASTGDVGARYTLSGAVSYMLGIDNSDSDKYKISYGATGDAALGTNDYLTIGTDGEVIVPQWFQVGTAIDAAAAGAFAAGLLAANRMYFNPSLARLQVYRDDANTNPATLHLQKSRSGGPASVSDVCGTLRFTFLNSLSVEALGVTIGDSARSVTSGAETDICTISVLAAGTARECIRFGDTAAAGTAPKVEIDANVFGIPLACQSWINNGSAIDADTRGDLASGLTGANRFFYDQSVATLTLKGIAVSSIFALDVRSDTVGDTPHIQLLRYNAASTTTPNGANLGNITWSGLNSASGSYTGAELKAVAGNNSANGYPAQINFYTNNGDGTGLLQQLQILGTGAINLGSVTDALTRGDLATGLTGANRVNYDQSDGDIENIFGASTVFMVPGVMFVQTADKSISNTVAETTMFGTGTGTLTLPANYLRVGRSIRIRMEGYYSTDTATPGNFEIRLKYGSTVLVLTAANGWSTSVSQRRWWLDAVITCRTAGVTGTVMAQLRFLYDTGASTLLAIDTAPKTATVTIDTTAATALDVTLDNTVADADNVFVCTNADIEALY